MRGGSLPLLVAGLWLAAGCGGGTAPPEAEPPGLVLVTLDTFRQDHLGCSGNPAVRTPHLDRLARRGSVWPDAVTAIPLTTPSHATILSGFSPRGHGLVKNRMRLAEGVITLPMRLRAAGWRTGAIVSSRVVLGPEMGLDRGFDSYDVIDPEERPASGEGARVADRAIEWLAERGGPRSFLWVHFFDPHLPYAAPPIWRRVYDRDYDGPFREPSTETQQQVHAMETLPTRDLRWLAAQYASEVSFLDTCVGRILRASEARPRTAFLVTADHGEGLYEHRGYFGHDTLLYETVLRVPLLLSGPEVPHRLWEAAARTTDVAATLLGLAGLDSGGTEGRDLLRHPAPTGDGLVFVTETHPAREKSSSVYALRTPDAKVVWTPRQRSFEWYDLESDPAETHDLAAEESRYFRTLSEDLELDLRTRPLGTAKTVDEETGGVSAETLEALRALGYVN